MFGREPVVGQQDRQSGALCQVEAEVAIERGQVDAEGAAVQVQDRAAVGALARADPEGADFAESRRSTRRSTRAGRPSQRSIDRRTPAQRGDRRR